MFHIGSVEVGHWTSRRGDFRPHRRSTGGDLPMGQPREEPTGETDEHHDGEKKVQGVTKSMMQIHLLVPSELSSQISLFVAV